MLRSYSDLLALTDKRPVWYDEQGVPRWCEFSPDRLGVYDDIVIFYNILCQSCHRPFSVASSQSVMDRMKHQWMYGDKWTNEEKEERIRPSIERFVQGLHYGDPPRHDDPQPSDRGWHGCVGDTMNCEDVEILEAWERYSNSMEWTRHPELEIMLPDGKELLGRTV